MAIYYLKFSEDRYFVPLAKYWELDDTSELILADGNELETPIRCYYIVSDEDLGISSEFTLTYADGTIEIINSVKSTEINDKFYYSCKHHLIKNILIGNANPTPTPTPITIPYFVSNDGNDINSVNGDENNPFKTLDYAISRITDQNTIYFKEGSYEFDEKEIANSDLSLQGYGNEKVIFDGTRSLNDLKDNSINGGNWEEYETTIVTDNNQTINNKKIFRIKLNHDVEIWQLFYKRKEVINARWPSAQWDDDSVYDFNKWGHGYYNINSSGDITDNSGNVLGNGIGNHYYYENGEIVDVAHEDISLYDFVTTRQGIDNTFDISDSLINLNVGSFKSYTKVVNSQTLDNTNQVIRLSYDNVDLWKEKHHYYYLENKLEYLNSENEWFFDNDSKYLYVWLENDEIPDLQNIRAKVQSYSLNVTADNVSIENINFFSTTIKGNNADNLKVNNCNFMYSSCYAHMLNQINYGTTINPSDNEVFNSQTNIKSSSNVVISKCAFRYTDGSVLEITGGNTTIEDCYFNYIDKTVCNLSSVMTTLRLSGSNNLIKNNTIHKTAASSTLNSGNEAIIEYNNLYESGYLQSDGAMIHSMVNQQPNVKIRYNWVHDTIKYGIRFDGNGEGYHGYIHHNIGWNCEGGIMVKGGELDADGNSVGGHFVYNNTFFNSVEKNDIMVLNTQVGININYGSVVLNNLCESLSGHRTDLESFENWIINSNNYSPTNVEDYLVDVNNNDFRPINDSSIVNAGTITYTNTEFNPSGVDSLTSDIGAMNYNGNSWVAGITWNDSSLSDSEYVTINRFNFYTEFEPTPTPIECASSPVTITVESEYIGPGNSIYKYTTSDSNGNGGLFGCINVNRGDTLTILARGEYVELVSHPLKITNYNDQGQEMGPLDGVIRTDTGGQNNDGTYFLTWVVPCDETITKYQYQCENHAHMRGTINVIGECDHTPTPSVTPTPSITPTLIRCVSSPVTITVESEYIGPGNSIYKYTTSDSDGNGGLFGCIDVERGSTLTIFVDGDEPNLISHPLKITNYNDQGQAMAPVDGVLKIDLTSGPTEDHTYALTWVVPCDETITKYQYQCENHAHMRGTINVIGECPTPTPTPTDLNQNPTPTPTPTNNGQEPIDDYIYDSMEAVSIIGGDDGASVVGWNDRSLTKVQGVVGVDGLSFANNIVTLTKTGRYYIRARTGAHRSDWMKTRISFLSGDYVGENFEGPKRWAQDTESSSIVGESFVVVDITQTTTFKIQTSVQLAHASGLTSGGESTLFVQKLASADGGGDNSSTTPQFCNVAGLATSQTISHNNGTNINFDGDLTTGSQNWRTYNEDLGINVIEPGEAGYYNVNGSVWIGSTGSTAESMIDVVYAQLYLHKYNKTTKTETLLIRDYRGKATAGGWVHLQPQINANNVHLEADDVLYLRVYIWKYQNHDVKHKFGDNSISTYFQVEKSNAISSSSGSSSGGSSSIESFTTKSCGTINKRSTDTNASTTNYYRVPIAELAFDDLIVGETYRLNVDAKAVNSTTDLACQLNIYNRNEFHSDNNQTLTENQNWDSSNDTDPMILTIATSANHDIYGNSYFQSKIFTATGTHLEAMAFSISSKSYFTGIEVQLEKIAVGGTSSSGGSSDGATTTANNVVSAIIADDGLLVDSSHDWIENSTKTATGNYEITFKSEYFTSIPAIIVAPNSSVNPSFNHASAEYFNVTTSGCHVYLRRPKDGSQVDASFSILAHHQDKSNTTSDGGSSTFASLTDTPSELSAGKYIKVNDAGDGIEFVDAPSGTSASSLQVIKDKSNFYTDLPDAIVWPHSPASIESADRSEAILHLKFVHEPHPTDGVSNDIFYECRDVNQGGVYLGFAFNNNSNGDYAHLYSSHANFQDIPSATNSLKWFVDNNRAVYYGASSSSGGSSTFASLTDTPSELSAGKYIKVNDAGDGIEFVDTLPNGLGSLDVIKSNTNFSGIIPDQIVCKEGAYEHILHLLYVNHNNELWYITEDHGTASSDHRFIQFNDDSIGSFKSKNTVFWLEEMSSNSLKWFVDNNRAIYHGGSSSSNGSTTSGSNIVTGTYTGNGEASQPIELGFRPAMVHVKCTSAPYYGEMTQIDGLEGASLRSYHEMNYSGDGVGIKITDTGFIAEGAPNNSVFNHNTSKYYYYAIASGTLDSSSSGGSQLNSNAKFQAKNNFGADLPMYLINNNNICRLYSINSETIWYNLTPVGDSYFGFTNNTNATLRTDAGAHSSAEFNSLQEYIDAGNAVFDYAGSSTTSNGTSDNSSFSAVLPSSSILQKVSTSMSSKSGVGANTTLISLEFTPKVTGSKLICTFNCNYQEKNDSQQYGQFFKNGVGFGSSYYCYTPDAYNRDMVTLISETTVDDLSPITIDVRTLSSAKDNVDYRTLFMSVEEISTTDYILGSTPSDNSTVSSQNIQASDQDQFKIYDL